MPSSGELHAQVVLLQFFPPLNATTRDGRPLRFLITGGTGFLGGHLLRALLARNFDVTVLKRRDSDLWRIADVQHRCRLFDLDETPMARIFDRDLPDVIVHCATNYGRKAEPVTDIIAANLTLPLALLEAAAARKVPVFINTDTILDKRVSFYSLSKKHFVEWLRLFATQVTCVNVAIEHFFGPNDDRSKFVTKIISDLLGDATVIDLTAGEQRRDFIYIDDVVDAFLRIFEFALSRDAGFHHFEIGSSQTVSIREFVLLAQRLAGNSKTDLRFGALPYRDNEVMESHVDTSALEALGWRPHVTLEEGLRRTMEIERKRQAK